MHAEPLVPRVERLADLPILWASVQRLRIATLLEQPCPTHHLWGGQLSCGEVVAISLVFLLSYSNQRLCRLQPWAAQRRRCT